MKIPTTPPGNPPFFHGPPVNGMEMNPQWQGNGVMMEGTPGNGGPYMMPHHVHPASYYGPGASPPHGAQQPPHAPPAQPQPQDFSEYMWMENEEEFDKQVMQQLEEEALMEQCIEAMLADEREAMGRGDISLEEQVSKSTLNPLAAEFIPNFFPSAAPTSTCDIEIPTVSSNTEVTPSESSIQPPTEALSELTISKSVETISEEPKVETNENAVSSERSKTDAVTEVESHDSKGNIAAVIEASAIVVVSAKNVLAKSSPEEKKIKDTSKDRKMDLERKKSAEGMKKEAVKKISEIKETVKKEKSGSANKAPDSKPKEKVRTISGDKDIKVVTKKDDKVKQVTEKAPEKRPADKVTKAVEKTKPVEVKEVKKHVEMVKKEEIVDLQGPPLPSVSVPVISALSTVMAEPEKQLTPPPPAVFNYAAAARANLPPKQPAAQAAAPPQPKESTPTPTQNANARPAPVKTETSGPKEARSASWISSRPKPTEKGGVKDDKRFTKTTTGAAAKKGKK